MAPQMYGGRLKIRLALSILLVPPKQSKAEQSEQEGDDSSTSKRGPPQQQQTVPALSVEGVGVHDTKTLAETRKATSGRALAELVPAPPAKKRKRHASMPRIWLRMELFELGLVPLPSKYAATLTVANVKKAQDALHARFQATAAEGEDAVMMDAEAAFVESDNLNTVTFALWKETVADIFQWREQDYKAFWLLLVQFHRQIPVKSEVPVAAPLDVHQCLTSEQVPVYKMVIFLFIQTVKPHSWRTKYSLDSINAVWYREHAESLAAAAALETPPSSTSAGSKSPLLGASSPRLLGSASPPPPASPHTVGMQDRSTSDAYYLAFVREKLEDLFHLLYPSVELTDESQTVVSADHVDLLGFLLCGGDASFMDKRTKLSSCYPGWEQPTGASGETESAEETSLTPHVENGAKICRFFKTHLSLNEKLYPAVGFTLGAAGAAQSSPTTPAPPAFSLNDDFSLDDSGSASASQDEALSPTVLSQLVKTTVIKRPEEMPGASNGQYSDLTIFSCHDAYIYILGPVRTHVMVTACKNCRIITAPNTGILSMDRCEKVQLTALSSLIRVSNCLESRLNSYTLSPIILSGENVNVELGPYNTKYPSLKLQLATVPFLFSAESLGCWNEFLDLDVDKDGMDEAEKEPISLQDPATFREVCVPVKAPSGAGPAERPFPIPEEYVAAVKKQHETVESLRQLVTSDEFDLTKKRTMEMVIQLRFKEWLAATSNVRQVLDLVQIERTRGSIGSASEASVGKES